MEKIRENVGAPFFWARVDEALGRNGERVSDFCRRIGISVDTVYGQRLNKVMPKDTQLELFSAGLGVSKTWLLTGIDPIEYTPEVREVVDVLSKDPSKLHVVRVVLGLE